MASRLALMALLFLGCGRVTFGAATDGLDAGLIAISVPTDAAHDSGAPGDLTDGRVADVSNGGGLGPGAPPSGGTSGASGSGGPGGAAGTSGPPGTSPPIGGAGGAGGASGCQSAADCKDGICDLLGHRCVGCLLDGDCKKGKGKLCDLTTLSCVECRTNADCDGDKTCAAGGTCD